MIFIMEKNHENTLTNTTVRYCVKDIDRSNNDYPNIKLPSDPWIPLEPSDRIHQELQEWGETYYIRAKKTDEPWSPYDGNYDIHERGKMELPKRWDEFPTDDLYQLLFEFAEDDEWDLRLYDPSDFFRYRVPELERNGNSIVQGEPLFALLTSKTLNSSAETDQTQKIAPWLPSQKFRIIPFNARQTAVKHVYKNQDKWPSPETIRTLADREELPLCQSPELTIYWDPQGKRHTDVERRQPIYSNRNVEEIEITLPCQGSFRFSTNREGTWINHGNGFGHAKDWELPEVRDWQGPYLKKNNGRIAVYVPCYPEPDQSRLPGRIQSTLDFLINKEKQVG